MLKVHGLVCIKRCHSRQEHSWNAIEYCVLMVFRQMIPPGGVSQSLVCLLFSTRSISERIHHTSPCGHPPHHYNSSAAYSVVSIAVFSSNSLTSNPSSWSLSKSLS
mmetsp:Transcript_2886/g.11006  ORF Transcript_2886/g.11006 Transcript_2886/m.11006 type:complete len:106 (+) Transcript_2886:55-372(+)